MSPAARRLRILIVHDDPQTIRLLGQPLHRRGIFVGTAQSEKEALAALEKKEYHMVLCGVTFPDMDGRDLIRRLIARQIPCANPDIRYMIVTAGHGPAAAAEFGYEHVITLPVRPNEVEHRILWLMRGVKLKPLVKVETPWRALLEMSLLHNKKYKNPVPQYQSPYGPIDPEELLSNYETCEIRQCFLYASAPGDICAAYISYYIAQGDKTIFSASTKGNGRHFDQVLNYLHVNGWQPTGTDERGRYKYFQRRKSNVNIQTDPQGDHHALS